MSLNSSKQLQTDPNGFPNYGKNIFLLRLICTFDSFRLVEMLKNADLQMNKLFHKSWPFLHEKYSIQLTFIAKPILPSISFCIR